MLNHHGVATSKEVRVDPLPRAVSSAELRRHLVELQRVADENRGTRVAGSREPGGLNGGQKPAESGA